jgi:transposase-like protein
MSVWQPVPWPSVYERDHFVLCLVYFRFGVTFRDVEEGMAARGVLVSYETVRRWCDKFGPRVRRTREKKASSDSDKWHWMKSSSR